MKLILHYCQPRPQSIHTLSIFDSICDHVMQARFEEQGMINVVCDDVLLPSFYCLQS